MLEFEKENYKKRVISITSKINSTSRRNLALSFDEILDLLELPHPTNELKKYFTHPSVLQSLLLNTTTNKNFSRDDLNEIQPYLTKAYKKLDNKKETYFVRYRILGPEGIYPNVELARNNCMYSVQNQLPIIWTKNRTHIDRNFYDNSVINWLTRNELKLATSILCGGKNKRFYLSFTSHNTIEIDWISLSEIPKELKNLFLTELFELNNKFTSIGVKPWHRHGKVDSIYYEFGNYENNILHFKKIFDSFSIQNDLLLRTCNFLVKSIMHWDNLINAEEAIANVFFCMEGCLHLIQKKFGLQNPKLNFNFLRKIFKQEFDNGEILLDIIQDCYHTRITLVHPEPLWGAEWKPFITSEDFYENFRICISLMNFILIDEPEWN